MDDEVFYLISDSVLYLLLIFSLKVSLVAADVGCTTLALLILSTWRGSVGIVGTVLLPEAVNGIGQQVP